MRTFLVLLGVSLLSAGMSYAQDLSDPRGILAHAVAQSQKCDFNGFEVKFDRAGKVEERKALKRSQRKMVENLTLPMLFRFDPDRFDLGDYATRTVIDDRAMLIVTFSPLPEDRQIKPKENEGKDSTRVMNNLSGYVLVDEATLEIVMVKAGVQAKTKGEYRFKWWIFPWTLEKMDITMNHRLHGDTWTPATFDMTLSGTWARYGTFFKNYGANFLCSLPTP